MTMRISGSGLVPWLLSKVADPFLHILRKGAEPKQLAFSATLGITLGVFPICVLVHGSGFELLELRAQGVSVFLCGVAIALLGSRCHVPSAMLFNFMATPIELRMGDGGAIVYAAFFLRGVVTLLYFQGVPAQHAIRTMTAAQRTPASTAVMATGRNVSSRF